MIGIGTPSSQSKIPRPNPMTFTIDCYLLYILIQLSDGSAHTDASYIRLDLLYTTTECGW
jgi:hypothetical protein